MDWQRDRPFLIALVLSKAVAIGFVFYLFL
jgi:hypothetical protein